MASYRLVATSSFMVVLVLLALVCQAAPRTKEAYLDETASDELVVSREKEGPTQEDLDMFFKDQAHLQGGTQPSTDTGIFGLPFLPTTLPFMTQLSDLLSVTSFFMLPNIDATQFGQVFVSAPMEFFNQLMSLMRLRDHLMVNNSNQTST